MSLSRQNCENIHNTVDFGKQRETNVSVWSTAIINAICLTHCGLAMAYGDIDLGQHWFM